jgi:hypothetical protein
MPTKYYKITTSILKGKKYFGLFVSNDSEFACDLGSFVRGWEADKFEKLSDEERVDFEKGLRRDVSGAGYSEVK